LVASSAFAAGPKAYVGNFKDNTVSVIDTGAGAVVATVPVAAGPHGMAITQDGRTVYVSGDGSSSLDVIDTATDKVVKTINVGKAPNGVALTPDNRLLLVTVFGENRVAFIDTSTQTVVATMAVPNPHTVAISPNGKLAYVTVQEPGHFGLALVDVAKRSVVRTLPLEKTPRDGEFGYDGKMFYFTQAGVSSVQVLDPASDKIVGEVPTGVSPHFVSYPRGSALGMVVVQGPGELRLFAPAKDPPARYCGRGDASRSAARRHPGDPRICDSDHTCRSRRLSRVFQAGAAAHRQADFPPPQRVRLSARVRRRVRVPRRVCESFATEWIHHRHGRPADLRDRLSIHGP
jgi:YVTN family beta-propeller protein